MVVNTVAEAVELLDKANANLEPELLPMDSARRLLDEYARAEKLASYGRTMLAARIDDAAGRRAPSPFRRPAPSPFRPRASLSNIRSWMDVSRSLA